MVVQDSKNFNYAAPYLTIQNADGFVLRYFAAAPNGYRVAYALVNGQKGNSILGNIDTLTDTLKGRKEIAERVLDMKLSGDSKYAYVVWQQGAAGGLRAYDLDTLAVVWDLPLAGARQIAAQRTATSQLLYVVKTMDKAAPVDCRGRCEFAHTDCHVFCRHSSFATARRGLNTR